MIALNRLRNGVAGMRDTGVLYMPAILSIAFKARRLYWNLAATVFFMLIIIFGGYSSECFTLYQRR